MRIASVALSFVLLWPPSFSSSNASGQQAVDFSLRLRVDRRQHKRIKAIGNNVGLLVSEGSPSGGADSPSMDRRSDINSNMEIEPDTEKARYGTYPSHPPPRRARTDLPTGYSLRILPMPIKGYTTKGEYFGAGGAGVRTGAAYDLGLGFDGDERLLGAGAPGAGMGMGVGGLPFGVAPGQYLHQPARC
ncbi:hypothetical protein B0H19DRAFT_1073715 [Mycena capillaripes]|nr:hypothetical protein B0H19DRAFT_1073715 [Mycena capillaripes]